MSLKSPLKPAAAPPTPPIIPLTPTARAAYQALYEKNEEAIKSTTNVGVLEALNAAQLDVRNTLTKDNMYRLHATSALYDALLEQITGTNEQLKDLQAQIDAVKTDFEYAGEILDAIDTVLKAV